MKCKRPRLPLSVATAALAAVLVAIATSVALSVSWAYSMQSLRANAKEHAAQLAAAARGDVRPYFQQPVDVAVRVQAFVAWSEEFNDVNSSSTWPAASRPTPPPTLFAGSPPLRDPSGVSSALRSLVFSSAESFGYRIDFCSVGMVTGEYAGATPLEDGTIGSTFVPARQPGDRGPVSAREQYFFMANRSMNRSVISVADYDPRTRSWFRAVNGTNKDGVKLIPAERTNMTWLRPTLSVKPLKLYLPLATALFAPSGEFVGVFNVGRRFLDVDRILAAVPRTARTQIVLLGGATQSVVFGCSFGFGNEEYTTVPFPIATVQANLPKYIPAGGNAEWCSATSAVVTGPGVVTNTTHSVVGCLKVLANYDAWPLARHLARDAAHIIKGGAERLTCDSVVVNGEDYFISATPLLTRMPNGLEVPGLPQVLVVALPEADLTSGMIKGRNYAIGAACAVFVLLAVIAVALARVLMRPVRLIASRMKRAASVVDAAPIGEDFFLSEVRDIAEAYDRMREELNHLMRYVPQTVLVGPGTDPRDELSPEASPRALGEKNSAPSSLTKLSLLRKPPAVDVEMTAVAVPVTTGGPLTEASSPSLGTSTSEVRGDGQHSMLVSRRAILAEENTFLSRSCTVVYIACFELPTQSANGLAAAARAVVEPVIEAALRNFGVVECMDPTSMFVTFNAHSVCHLHEDHAVKFVRAIRDRLPSTHFVAVDSTTCFVGTVGAQGRNSRVVIGEAVDVTRRLPSLMRAFLETNVVITERCARNAPSVAATAIDSIAPAWMQPGRAQQLYICSMDENEGDAFRKAFGALCQGRFSDAEAGLHAALAEIPGGAGYDSPPQSPRRGGHCGGVGAGGVIGLDGVDISLSEAELEAQRYTEGERLRRLLCAAVDGQREASIAGGTGSATGEAAFGGRRGLRYVRSEAPGWAGAGAVARMSDGNGGDTSKTLRRETARAVTSEMRRTMATRVQTAAQLVAAPLVSNDLADTSGTLFTVFVRPNPENGSSSAGVTETGVAASVGLASLRSVQNTEKGSIASTLGAPTAAPSSSNTVVQGGPTAVGALPSRASPDASATTVIVAANGQSWHRARLPMASGASAAVYTGLSPTGALCAIKAIDIGGRGPGIVDELLAEVDVLTRLHHAHIVSYVSCAHDADNFYLFLEYMTGGSLLSVVQTYGRLAPDAVRRFAAAALDGLCYLHENGVVHCDIKPHNLLIGADGVVKLGDFGSSLSLRAGSSLSHPAVGGSGIRGTVWYMAPEVAFGDSPTPESDMWSFGVTMLHLLLGDVPWETSRWRMELQFLRELSVNQNLVPEIPPALVPEPLGDMLRRCLQRDPALRPTAADLLAAHLAL